MDELLKPIIIMFVVVLAFSVCGLASNIVVLWTDYGKVLSIHYGTIGSGSLFGGSLSTIEYVVVQSNNHGQLTATDSCQRSFVNQTVTFTEYLKGGLPIINQGCY